MKLHSTAALISLQNDARLLGAESSGESIDARGSSRLMFTHSYSVKGHEERCVNSKSIATVIPRHRLDRTFCFETTLLTHVLISVVPMWHVVRKHRGCRMFGVHDSMFMVRISIQGQP